MLQSKLGGATLVQDDVGDSLDRTVASQSHGRQGKRLGDGGVYGDKAFDTPLEQELGIAFEKFAVVAVGHGKVEKTLFAKKTFNATDDHGTIRVANFRGDHTNRKGSLHAESARQKIRPIIQLPGSGEDPVFGVLGHGAAGRGIVKDG